MLSNHRFSSKVVILSAGLILGSSLLMINKATQNVHADTLWIAKTPNEIGNLNSNGSYTVQEGDTIWAIGMHFNINPTVIENVNAINNPYDLQIGTILQLHVYDNGKKANLSLQNGKQKVQTQLNNSDKLDQHKAFGKSVNSKEITANVTPNKSTNRVITKSTNNTSSTSEVNSKPAVTTKLQSYNDNEIAMAAYNASYNHYYGNGNHVHGIDVYMSNNNGQYTIGQGTADSTATITINGNNVVTSFPNISGGKVVSYDTQTFNINKLMNQQYQNTTQKNYINNMINDGYNNMNKVKNSYPHSQN